MITCFLLVAQVAVACPAANCGWTFHNYENRLRQIAATNDGFFVEGPAKKCDTLWRARSSAFPIPKDVHRLEVRYHVSMNTNLNEKTFVSVEAERIVRFYEKGGTPIDGHVDCVWVKRSAGSAEVVLQADVPTMAVSAALAFGADDPNVLPSERFAVQGISFGAAQGEPKGFTRLWTFARGFAAEEAKTFPPVTSNAVEVAKNVPHVTLRDDGITLIDGEPFYPIGTYAVVTQAFNNFSFDKAFADLAKGGFNLAFTYYDSLDPAFLAGAAKHGVRLWGRTSWKRHLSEARFRPEFIAWYCGDDTYNHNTPEGVNKLDRALKSTDPHRLTCQADMYFNGQNSRYQPFVNATDVFMPEIYPFRGAMPSGGPTHCVSKTIETVDRVLADVRMYGDGRPKACWAILQYFRGYDCWLYWPTREQFLATVFAAVIRGAHGITLYTYGKASVDTFDEKTKKGGGGFASSPQRFADACEMATRLKELAPVLVTRTPVDQPLVRVLDGPRESADGRTASVVCLKKTFAGKTYLLAVNAGKAPVRAAFDVGGKVAEVLWENGRRLTLEKGTLIDLFDTYGVHVYRITD